MEKRKAHYSLATIQTMILHESQRVITRSAFQGAFALGLDENDIVNTVLALLPKDLYKSMTVNQNSTVWQDVYHKKINNVELYIKLQLVDKAVVISFKEL